MALRWHAVYTRPRWEKKVNETLLRKGIESYCPLNKVRRKWSDRIKVVEEPLFKSYVFVKVDDLNRIDVRMTDGVINFVYWNGKPAIIKEHEVLRIKKFLNEYENVQLVQTDVKSSNKIRINSGIMMDLEGKVLEVKNKIVKVAINSLGYILIATIEKSNLSIIE